MTPAPGERPPEERPAEHVSQKPSTAGRTPVLNPPPFPEGEDELGSGSAAGAPRWVSLLGIVLVIVLVLTIVLLHLTGVIKPGGH